VEQETLGKEKLETTLTGANDIPSKSTSLDQADDIMRSCNVAYRGTRAAGVEYNRMWF